MLIRHSPSHNVAAAAVPLPLAVLVARNLEDRSEIIAYTEIKYVHIFRGKIVDLIS
jgi:hypothetical protein